MQLIMMALVLELLLDLINNIKQMFPFKTVKLRGFFQRRPFHVF